MCAHMLLRHPLYTFHSSTLYKERTETKLIRTRNIQSFSAYCIPILCTAPLRCIDLLHMSLFTTHSLGRQYHTLYCHSVLYSAYRQTCNIIKWNCRYCLRCLGRYNFSVIVHKYITTGLLVEFPSLIFCEQNNEVRRKMSSWSKRALTQY
jgi:hypothetical protein